MKKMYVRPTTALLELAVQHMLAASTSFFLADSEIEFGGTFGDAPAFDSSFMDEE